MPSRFSPGRLGPVLSLVLIGFGVLAIGLGYNGMAGNLALPAQLPYVLSGGFVGLALVIFGTGLMINTSAREDRQRLEAVLLQLVEAQGVTASPRVPSTAEGLFAAGAASFHQPDCRLVDGREQVAYVTGDEAAAKGLKACRVCQPQTASTDVTVR